MECLRRLCGNPSRRPGGQRASTPVEKAALATRYYVPLLQHTGREAWPLVNFKEINCMVYCEHVLAMAISDNFDNFFNNLQQIRYKDGIIGMKTRNHFGMADWITENGLVLVSFKG